MTAKDWLDELLAKPEEPREPIDVAVLLGKKVVTVRVPVLGSNEFDELVLPFGRHIAFRDPMGCWFDLEKVTSHHPGISIIHGKKVDDLMVMRDGEPFYRWPEIYGSLRQADRLSLQAVVWGVHIHEPEQALEKASRAKLMSEVAA